MAAKFQKLRPRNPYIQPVATNPYIAARQERQDRQLNILAAGKLWRNIAVLALLGNMALSAGMVGMIRMRKETRLRIALSKAGKLPHPPGSKRHKSRFD